MRIILGLIYLLFCFFFSLENHAQAEAVILDKTTSEVSEPVTTTEPATAGQVDKPIAPDALVGGEQSMMSGGAGADIGSLTLSSVSSPSINADPNTGAATASIPLIIPPGRKGVQPGLALVYNSNKNNGWLGVGWDIPIPFVQRSTKFGVDYNSNEFVANGSTELVSRGDWGANYYGSKIEGAFSKYYYNTSTGGWEVTDKSGTKYYFGTTASSRQDFAGKGTFKWMLDKVQDTNGNFMTYAYWQDQGEIYIDRIDYTGNGSVSPTNYVVFYRETRSDAPAMYLANASVRTAYKISTIDIFANSNRARTYKLTYGISSSTKRSTLSSVEQYDENGISGSALPATTFVWTTASGFENRGALISTAYGNWAGYPDRIRQMDVNGDGRQDIVIGPEASTGGTWYVLLSTGTSYEDQGAWISNAYASWYQSSSRVRSMDVNADGKQDIVIGPDANGKWYVLQSTGTSFEDKGAWITGAYGNWDGSADRIRPMDVNGDAKDDMVIGPDAYGKFYVLLSTGTSFVDSGTWVSGAYGASNRVRAMDVNGDAKQDIVIGPDLSGNWYAYPSTGTSFVNNGAWITGVYAGWANSMDRIRSIDVNGDGRQDIVIGPDAYGKWYVLLSTGASFVDKGAWITGAYAGWAGSSGRVRSMDVNADRNHDIVIGPDAYGKWYVLISKGDSFEDRGEWISGAYSSFAPSSPSHVRPADVTGDGRSDLLLGPDWSGKWFGLVPSGPVPDLLSTIQNGLGATTTISYAPSSTYTNKILPFVMQTTSSITTNDGLGTNSTTSYTYSGGLYDYANRELLGFEAVKSTDPAGSTVETLFKQDEVFYKGLPYDQTVKSASGNTYSRVVTTYQSVSPYAGVNFPYVFQRNDYIYDGTGSFKSSAVSFTYDSYGNITRKYMHGDMDVTGDEIDDYTEYTYDTTKWILNLPSHKYLLDSGEVKRAEGWFTYDANNGNLLTETKWLNGGSNPVVTYGYDPYGNRSSVTDPKGNPPTTITYDASHTYPVQKTNALGQIIMSTYDFRFGKVLTETDPNGNLTTYEYDSFGRTSKIVGPNDTIQYPTVSYAYLNFGTPGSQRVVEYRTEQSGTANYIWNETYFDGLGRAIKARSEGPDNKIIVQQTTYNDRGLKVSESLPYFEGLETPRYITFSYDAVGRPTLVTNPDATTIQTIYDKGLLTTIDPNGHKKVHEKDVYGRLAKVEEYTGTGGSHALYATTAYQYDAVSNLTRTTDALGNQINLTYDTIGRKISMTDPDMGTWNYAYDANGNLTSQTDSTIENVSIGGFETATPCSSGWLFYVDTAAGASATCSGSTDSPYEGSYKGLFTITSGGSATGSIQLFQGSRPIQNGRTYQVTFAAKATANRTIRVGVIKNGSPWTNYMVQGFQTVNLTTNWQLFTINFTANATASDARINIYLGANAEDVSLDAVSWRVDRQTITFNYDALNRVTLKNYPSGTDVTHTYDETWSTNPKGRLTTMVDGSGTTKFYYDKLGNITKSIRTIDSINYTIETTFDALGRTTSIKYPDNEIVNYTYDTAGNLAQAGSYATYASYNALGQAANITYGNGVTTTYQYYNTNNRLSAINTSKQSQNLLNSTYSYDNVGNIFGITDNLDSSRSQSFTYDDLNRLTQAQSTSYGTLAYSYNQIGNMLSKEGISYTYGGPRPHAVTSTSDGKSYAYDANGNMVSDGQRTIAYNYDNMPSSVTNTITTTFVYDGNGLRVKKVTPSATTIYISKVYECVNGACAKYIFAGDTRVALKNATQTLYYHQDHLNSSSIVTDATGTKVEEVYYYPYGATRSDTGSVSVNHKYTSQEFDSETGLYYYGARYYNPSLGRFISADTMIPYSDDPQAFNRYSYVRNNPLIYTDPTGHIFGWDDIIAMIIVAAVSYFVEQQGGNVDMGGGGSLDSEGNIDLRTGSSDMGSTYSVGRIYASDDAITGYGRLEVSGSGETISGEKYWYFRDENTKNSESAYEGWDNNTNSDKKREISWDNFVDMLNNTNLEFGVETPIGGFSGKYNRRYGLVEANREGPSINRNILPKYATGTVISFNPSQNVKGEQALNLSLSTPLGGYTMSYDGNSLHRTILGPRWNFVGEYGENAYIGLSWDEK